MISAISDIITALSVLGTAIIALCGLCSWKKEMKGKAEYEIARKLMRDTYLLANALYNSRCPFQSIYFPDDPNLTERQQRLEAYKQQYVDLLKPISEAYVELEGSCLDAQVLWGKDVKELIEKLFICARKFQIAAENYLDDKKSEGELFKGSLDFAKSIRKDLFRSSDEKDPLSIEINENVKAIEMYMKPKLAYTRDFK